MNQDVSKTVANSRDLNSPRFPGLRNVWKHVPRRRGRARRNWIDTNISEHLKDDIGLRF